MERELQCKGEVGWEYCYIGGRNGGDGICGKNDNGSGNVGNSDFTGSSGSGDGGINNDDSSKYSKVVVVVMVALVFR